jgi:hypothetical protein
METIAVLAFASLVGALLAHLISQADLNSIDDCEHKNIFIFTDEAIVGCEKTTITCLDCKKRLSTKTDCR